MQSTGNSSNNAQGVVPGYQPLRQSAQRSNTAGKHGAQQQLTGSSQPLPTTSSGSRPSHSLKPKNQISVGKPGQESNNGGAIRSHVQHSNPNFSNGNQVFEKPTKVLAGSDPMLKKQVSSGASPRPNNNGASSGPNSIQIGQIIRNHYQGATNGANSQQNQSLQNSVHQANKSKSTNQRPLRSQRGQMSNSLVGSLQLQNNGQGTNLMPSYDGTNFTKNGSQSSRIGGNNHHVVKSLTHNQTPNISNFHPPAIQKHDNSAQQSSRRNARHAQISKNHPDLMVQNSQERSKVTYSYSKRNNQTNGGNPNQHSYQHMQPVQMTAGQGDARADSNNNKYRPNTASESLKLIQQQQDGNTGSPLLPSQQRQGLVPQVNDTSAAQQSILAVSARQRRGGAPVPQQQQHGLPQTTHNQMHRSGQVGNPMSLSHDQPLPNRRTTKEDTLFPDKKGQTTQGQGPSLGNLTLQPPGATTQPSLNTIGAFNVGNGGQTDRGPPSTSRVQTLDTYNNRGQNNNNHTGNNSQSHISPLLNHPGQVSSHQRITSQHAQSIPQYRKTNLRDLRKSQRLSNNANNQQQQSSKDKSKVYDHDQNNMINPLTSVELNSHFQKRNGGGPGGQKNGSNPMLQGGLQKSNHAFENTVGSFKNNQTTNRNKETNRSLDAKRQLMIPSNSGIAGVGNNGNTNHQLITPSISGSVNKSLQSGSNQGQASLNGQTNLLPSGYKRRSKRPGQSLNQLQFSHQGGLTSVFPDNNGLAKDSQQSLTQQVPGRKRLELSTINNPQRRGDTGELSNGQQSQQPQPLQTERNKHSRQKGQVAHSFDGALPKRNPSNHSIKRGATLEKVVDTDKQPNSETPNQTATPSRKPEGNERFNAITKFAFATSCGHQPGNPYKVNQDTYTLAPNMVGQQGFHLFVVCDGHGVNGHKVSADIKTELPKELERQLQTDKDFLTNSGSREFCERIPRYFRDAFGDMHDRFMNSRSYDCHLSGSTVTAVLFDSLRIYCANAGDSRAVLYTQGKKGGLKVTPLSEDHKPSLPKEKARVEKMNGRVNPIIGPQGQHLGPDRVWMKTEDTPGLAMSRSLGDGLAHSVGVSWEPEVKQLVLEPSDKFIVIASDGVWEFLSNEQIARIVWPYYIKNSPEQAGNAIVRASAQKWKENDTVIDDITCITIFLEVD